MPLPSSTQHKPSARKQKISNHFAKANNYNKHALVQGQICKLLVKKIANKQQTSVLEVGAGTGQLTELLIQNVKADNWHINELCASHKKQLAALLPHACFYIGDAETINLSCDKNTNSINKHSLIISANTVQWFDNPLEFITKSLKHLAPNGQLLFNTFTTNNFKQIKQLTGQGLNYPTINQWENTIKRAGINNYKLSTQLFELTFDTPYDVLQHIKQTGVTTFNTNLNDDKNVFAWTKSSLETFISDYQENYSTADGNVVLTYESLIIDIKN